MVPPQSSVGVPGQAALLQAAKVLSILWLFLPLGSSESSPFSQQKKNGTLQV